MDLRFVLLIVAIFVIFISMGKNPFEVPEDYVPPDEFKDGIRAKIDGNSTMGGAGLGVGGLGGGGTMPGYGGDQGGSFQPGNSGFGSMVQSPGSYINPSNPALQPTPSPYGGMGGLQQQQGIATMPAQPAQPAPQGIAPPVAPQGANPFTGQAPIAPDYANPQAQPYQPPAQPANPTPFQQLPSPGSMLNLPSYVPQFRDTQGRILAFSGMNVYTTDTTGRAMLVQDGKYQLSDGYIIVVKGGKRWWPLDANKL